MALSRRDFAVWTAATVAALRLEPALVAVRPGSPLDRLFSKPAAARKVGCRVLAAMPETARPAMALATELSVVAKGATDALGHALAERIEGDFRDGRIVIIDGWVLARSEALACAATALGPGVPC
jgi:hypothetical protein